MFHLNSNLAAPEEGHNLRSGAIRVGAECRAAGSLGDLLPDCPQNRVCIVVGGLHIGKGIVGIACRRLLRTPQEGYSLCAGAGGIGTERSVAGALGDAVLHRPQHRVIIVAVRGNIGKRHGTGFRLGTASGTPQEGHSLCAGAGGIGTERGVAGTLGDAVLRCPIHGVFIITAGGNIHKHAGLRAAVLHEDNLDGMGFADVLEGVGLHRTDAVAVDFDVGNGVALVRGNGKGLIGSLADADIAGGGDGAAGSGNCLDGVGAGTVTIVAPVGIHSGICREYGGGRDLCAATLFRVPAVEAVLALGGAGQRNQFLIGCGHAADRRRTAVAVKGDGELGGRRRRIFLEDGLDLHIVIPELNMLLAQINPHFLYNTLDTIYMLARINGEETTMKMIQALSRYLRLSLSKGSDIVTVEDELENVKSYMEIQQIRNANLFRYEIECKVEEKSTWMLKLILQPLVENAIKHGFCEIYENGLIRIEIAREDSQLKIVVFNNGKPIDREMMEKINALNGHPILEAKKCFQDKEHGYGVVNVLTRLRLKYGEDVLFYYEAEENGTRCTIQIPDDGKEKRDL